MKKSLLTLALFMIPFLCAFATDRTISLSLTSNYVFRGETQTDDKAAVQAAYQLSQFKKSGFYAGFFASNVSKGAEVDIFGGWKLAFGRGDAFVLDLGAIEYMYTDNKPTFSHEFYTGVQYEASYIKYYLGEEEAGYLDIGTGFSIAGGMELLFHFGEVFATAQNGNDASVSLQKRFDSTIVGLTATYEDKTTTKESELFAFISIDL